MSYQLDFSSCIKACLINPIIIVVIILVFLIFSVGLYNLRKRNELNKNTIALAIGCMIFIVISLIGLPLQYVGSGWYLEGDKLSINLPEASEVIDVFSAEMILVDYADPSWQLSWRINATGTPDLLVGLCRAENGNKVVVFRHLGSSKKIILRSNNRYYLLAHPGVELLYQEMVARGVKVGEF